MKKIILLLLLSLSMTSLIGCNPENKNINLNKNIGLEEKIDLKENINKEKDIEVITDSSSLDKVEYITQDPVIESSKEEIKNEDKEIPSDKDIFKGYTIIEVDGGNTSGYRLPNVAVDIGYGDREYWAFTNEHGQLIKVVADEIILQDDSTEPVNNDGRYFSKIADVPGVGSDTGYDRGHVIADSLGGVANAYNITPQNATLNRHGDQAYMEKVIRDAGGCSNFEAIITYPNTETQIPSRYKFTYALMGDTVIDEFENINPDEYNQSSGLYDSNTITDDKLDNTNSEVIKEDIKEIIYTLNTNSKKIHYPDCYSVDRMSEKNKKETNLSKEELISKGYASCGNCKP